MKNAEGTFTLTRKKRQIFTFDSAGNLTGLKDLNGYTTTVTRPDASTIRVTDSANRALAFTLTGNHITGVSDPIGRTMTFRYDASGNLTEVVDVGGGTSQFTYDDSHRMKTMRSPKYFGDTTTTPSPVITNRYDGQGRVDLQTDELGRATAFDYQSVPGSTKVTDPKGNATLYTYEFGTLKSETQGYGTPQAATTSYVYDPVTLGTTSITDPNGKVSTAEYDTSGNKTKSTDALNRIMTYEYDALNNPTKVTDAAGVPTVATYDQAGNLKTIDRLLTTSNEHEITTYNYDPNKPGDVISIVDPMNHATTFTYNTTGDVESVTDATGYKTTFAYNGPVSIGQVVSSVAPRGNVTGANPAAFTTTFGHDAFGNVTETRDPLWVATDPTKHRTLRHYDANGNLDSETDGNNNTTTYSYDPANQLLSVNRPNNTSLRNEYWPDGSLKAQIDGANQATSYAYDPLGRVITSTDPLNRVTAYTYDPAGNLLTKADPGGSCGTSPGVDCTRFSYDNANQLKTISYSDGTPGVTYDYDNLGRRFKMIDGTGTTTYTYDSLSRLKSVTNGAGAAVDYEYDRANRQ